MPLPLPPQHDTTTNRLRAKEEEEERNGKLKTDSFALNTPDLLFVFERPTRPDPGLCLCGCGG